MAAEQKFVVLIVGGSVAGLVLANALERAGIEFLVLEGRDIAPSLGASISVLSHTSKIFEQLGAWDAVCDATVPLTDRLHFDSRGRLFENSTVLRLIHAQTKRPFLFLERRRYLEILYGNIKDKSKVHPHTKVVSFHEDENGVEVTTSTGKVIRGSILVGADGVHSTIRGQIAEAIVKTDPVRYKALTQAFNSSYRTIFGTSANCFNSEPDKPLLPEGCVHNVYYRNVSGITASGVNGLVFWFLFVKQDHQTTSPNNPRYTDEDAQATIDKYGHLALGPGYTFRDLWDSRVRAGMVAMEEGVVQSSWNSGGRVVLMGDAIMKATINPGLAGNTAVEGACNLVNELHPLLQRSPNPSRQEIQSVFEQYERNQRPRANACVKMSGFVTRYEAMESWWLRLLRLIMPWLPDRLKARGFLDFMAPAGILKFLPDPDKEHHQ